MTDEKKTEKVRVLAHNDEGQIIVASERGRIGITKKMQDGVPLAPTDDLVSFKQTDEKDVFEMTTEHEGLGSRGNAKGPAKFATRLYREGWDAVFGTDDEEDERMLN